MKLRRATLVLDDVRSRIVALETDSVNIPVIERAKAGFSFGHNIVKNNCIQCGLVESWLIPDLLYKAFCDESDLCIPVSE